MLNLRMTRLRVRWRFAQAIHLPAYPGSLVRGLIGHGLKRAVCLFRERPCQGCPVERDCAYARFFQPPAGDANSQWRFSHTPPPYVLEFSLPLVERLEGGAVFQFHLTVLVEDFLPYLVVAMEQAGRIGAGRRRVPFEVISVEREQPPGSERWLPWREHGPALLDPEHDPVPCVPERVKVHLQTPLRLKRHGRLVRPEQLDPATFVGAVNSRIRDLEWLYGHGEPVSRPRVHLPIDGDAEHDRWLNWRDWSRYSNRQGTQMKLGGIVGQWILSGPPLAPWWPLLWWGQWLHAGKQTSMGLGQYRLEIIA